MLLRESDDEAWGSSERILPDNGMHIACLWLRSTKEECHAAVRTLRIEKGINTQHKCNMNIVQFQAFAVQLKRSGYSGNRLDVSFIAVDYSSEKELSMDRKALVESMNDYLNIIETANTFPGCPVSASRTEELGRASRRMHPRLERPEQVKQRMQRQQSMHLKQPKILKNYANEKRD